jgi:hypothetical protein
MKFNYHNHKSGEQTWVVDVGIPILISQTYLRD